LKNAIIVKFSNCHPPQADQIKKGAVFGYCAFYIQEDHFI